MSTLVHTVKLLIVGMLSAHDDLTSIRSTMLEHSLGISIGQEPPPLKAAEIGLPCLGDRRI